MFKQYQHTIWFLIIRWIIAVLIFFAAFYITRRLLGYIAEMFLRHVDVNLFSLSELGYMIMVGGMFVIFLKFGYDFVLQLCPKPKIIAWIFIILCLFILGSLPFGSLGMDSKDIVATVLVNLISTISLGWIIYDHSVVK
jgi:hypothetical protein